jgi:hypothetical protein
MSEFLPFAVGVSPVMAQRGFQSGQDLGVYPSFLTGCVKNLRAHHVIQDREEYSEGNMAIDSRPVINQFLSLNYYLQTYLAKKIGFESILDLQKILMN